LEEVEAVLDWI